MAAAVKNDVRTYSTYCKITTTTKSISKSSQAEAINHHSQAILPADILSGYVMSASRTRLGVRNYERLAMLSSIMQNMFIDVDWVAKEYISRTNRGQWKKENTVDALKCWNLERIIESEAFGKAPPNEITFDDYIRGDLARM